jgi:hypothetical protein
LLEGKAQRQRRIGGAQRALQLLAQRGLRGRRAADRRCRRGGARARPAAGPAATSRPPRA